MHGTGILDVYFVCLYVFVCIGYLFIYCVDALLRCFCNDSTSVKQATNEIK